VQPPAGSKADGDGGDRGEPEVASAGTPSRADRGYRAEMSMPPTSPAPERGASATARGAAGLRAAHILLDDPPPILDDRVSVQLLGPDAAASIRANAGRFAEPASRVLRCEIAVRNRYAEDCLRAEVAAGRVGQYVILGAGLDTFGYRQPAWAAGVAIFEVDHPASQADKRIRLKRAGIDAPANVRYVEADLESNSLLPTLIAAGIDPARPAFVACLGVLIYLDEPAAYRIMNVAGSLAPGSRFVFTFSRPDATTSKPPPTDSAAGRAAAAGEPWRTRLEPRIVEARLREAGFRTVDFLYADHIGELYLRHREDGLRQPPRVVIADARV
jgi:methyltransferase (TIGR00027 family)